jgi:hypothetical protein
MMPKIGLLSLALVACVSAEAQAPVQPVDVFAGLAGSCWKADIGEDLTDTHCFSVAVGGKLVMDVHKVRSRSGGVGYEGVTLYRLEKASVTVRYEYYTSNGELMTGTARRDGQTIRFPETVYQVGDLVWYLGADAYEVVPLAMPEAKRKFVKVGPAPEGGF